MSSAGTYRLCQVSVGVKNFELLSPRMGCKYHFVVEKVSGKIEVDSVESNLIAGIEQLISLTLHTGSNSIDQVILFSFLVNSALDNCLTYYLSIDAITFLITGMLF